MMPSSLSHCFRLRYAIHCSRFFRISQRCCANHCTKLLTASSFPKILHVNSQLFEENKFLSKWIPFTYNLRMCETYTGALVDRTFHSDAKLRRNDKVSNDFSLIYRIPKDRWLRLHAIFTFAFVVISPLFTIRSFYKFSGDDVELSSAEIMEAAGNDILMLTDTEYAYMSLLLFCVSTLLYIFIKRFPLRIYHNGRTYIAVYMNTCFPLLFTNHAFTSVRKYRIPTIFPKTLYLFGRRRARIFDEYFRCPADQMKMIEEDSPEDRRAEKS